MPSSVCSGPARPATILVCDDEETARSGRALLPERGAGGVCLPAEGAETGGPGPAIRPSGCGAVRRQRADAIPARSVLPAHRGRLPTLAASRATGRHLAAGPQVPVRVPGRPGPRRDGDLAPGDGRNGGFGLAGECPRTSERDRCDAPARESPGTGVRPKHAATVGRLLRGALLIRVPEQTVAFRGVKGYRPNTPNRTVI